MPFRSVPLSYEAHTQLLREIAGLSGLPLHEKLDRALRTAARLLDLDLGFLSHIQEDLQTIEAAVSDDGALHKGDTFPLEMSYCAITLEAKDVVAINWMGQSRFADRPCYEAFGLESYLGAPVVVGGELYGTVAFASRSHRTAPFSDADVTLVRLLATWLGTTIERMRADDAHRRSEHRLASVLNAAPDAVLLADLDRTIEYVNPSFERLFGWSADEIVGQSTAVLYASPEDFEAQGQKRYGTSTRNALHDEPYVTEYRRADGSTFLGESVGGPAKGDSGQDVQFFLGFIRDVTAREAARAEADAAAEAKAEAVRSKERFLANMSHEMRTPLNAVLGLGHLLAQTPLSSSQSDLLTGITTSADALLGLIDDLLDFARLGAGKLPFEAIPFAPAEVVRQVETMVRPRVAEKELRLSVSIAPNVPERVVGDPSRFRQILMNLTSNAVKFTSTGDVSVSLTSTDTPAGPCLCVEVADTGIGISADRRKAIFDPFVQASDDAARRFGGTGLGLAIVKDLVERQGGAIEVDSAEGSGSTFRVTLPMALPSAEQTAAQAAPAPAPSDLTGLRVLVAEDNEMNRLVARRTLQSWGVEVTEARDGHEAVAAATEADPPFDLVLMDLQMPGLDGIAATQQIRAAGGEQSRVPIVALTASVLAYQRAEVVGAGLDDFLLKPFEPATLRERIAAWTRSGPEGLASPPETDDDAFDSERLAQSALGDPDLARQVKDLFLSEGQRQIEALAQAMAIGDLKQLEQVAHALMGQAAYVGARELARTSEAIVTAVRADETDTLAARVRAALRQYRTATDELRRLTQSSPV